MLSAEQFVTGAQHYYWPFLRFSALFLAAPIFSASSFPVRARVLLAVLITALVAPSIRDVPQVTLFGAKGLLLGAQQILVGLGMGFVIQMTFGALVIAGQSIAMTMGLGFAMSVDPQNGVQVPVLSQLYVVFATLLFLVTDSHLMLIETLVQSFTSVPVTLSGWDGNMLMNIAAFGSQMFLSALLISLPLLTAILLINLAFGVITRAAPQLNIFAVGFPVTIAAGFVFILLSLPTVFDLITGLFEIGFSQLTVIFRQST